MNWKSTAAVSGATLMATWVGWTPPYQSAVTTEPPVVADASRTDPVDIAKQADRLQIRVRAERAYRDPQRNPFRFVARPVPVPQPHARESAAPAPATETVPEVFPLVLAGMAADTIDGATLRTAILTFAREVVFAKEGDAVGPYTVSRIDETGVEVAAGDGTVFRLALTP